MVLSNGDSAQQQRKLAATCIDRYFDTVMTSSDLGAAKPDPEVFALACALLRLPVSDVVYVGDNLDVDAVASRDAGLLAVWLDRHETFRARNLRACGRGSHHDVAPAAGPTPAPIRFRDAG